MSPPERRDDALVVRTTTAEDAADLRAIRLEALADSPEAFGTTLDQARAMTEAEWVERARAGNHVLAVRDGRVVGMAAAGTNEGYPGTRWLYGMYVTPDERGRGAAERLVEAVVEATRAAGADALHLQVTGAMGRARAFYARLGFEPTGERFAMRRDPSLELATLVRPLGRESVRVARTRAEGLVDLRTAVLREGDPARAARHPLDDEPASWHFGAYLGESLVGCASFYPSTWPLDPALEARQLRFMAVDPSCQGRGVGRILLDHAEAILAANSVQRVWAHARDTALGFYLAVGWTVVEGSEHVSVETGLPHTTVVRTLGPVAASAR